jgi:hypothetical protein
LPDSASSYSGIVILIAVSGLAAITVLAVHGWPRTRCGGRRPGTAASRIRGRRPNTAPTVCRSRCAACSVRALFQASERVDMPAPGDRRPARLEVRVRDLIWDWLYAPVADGLGWFTERINGLQFLTIRRYLTFMFAALSFLLAIVAVTQ